jgi:hypothetical protein
VCRLQVLAWRSVKPWLLGMSGVLVLTQRDDAYDNADYRPYCVRDHLRLGGLWIALWGLFERMCSGYVESCPATLVIRMIARACR